MSQEQRHVPVVFPLLWDTEASVPRVTLGSLPEDPPARGILSSQPSPDGCPSVLAGLQAADVCSAAKMMQHVAAAVCTLYSVAYSGYFLTHLARKSRFSLGAASVALGLLCAFCSSSGAELTLEQNCHEDTIALGELLPAAAAEKGGVCSQRGVHSICNEPWGVLFPQAGSLCQQSLELPPFAAPAKN